jgi:hypothetical protein
VDSSTVGTAIAAKQYDALPGPLGGNAHFANKQEEKNPFLQETRLKDVCNCEAIVECRCSKRQQRKPITLLLG